MAANVSGPLDSLAYPCCINPYPTISRRGIQVPPLRERREDIPSLVRHFIQRFASRMNRVIDSIPSAAIEALTRYDWPGNIRELQNVMERSVILTQGKTLTIAMPEILSHSCTTHRDASEVMLNAERESILRALKQS